MKLHVYCKTMEGVVDYAPGSGICTLAFADGTLHQLPTGARGMGFLYAAYTDEATPKGQSPLKGHDLLFTVIEDNRLGLLWSRDMWSEEGEFRGWPDLKPGEEADVYCASDDASLTLYRGVIDRIEMVGSRYIYHFRDGSEVGVSHEFVHTALANLFPHGQSLIGRDIVYTRAGSLEELAYFMPYEDWCFHKGQSFAEGTAIDLVPGTLHESTES